MTSKKLKEIATEQHCTLEKEIVLRENKRTTKKEENNSFSYYLCHVFFLLHFFILNRKFSLVFRKQLISVNFNVIYAIMYFIYFKLQNSISIYMYLK